MSSCFYVFLLFVCRALLSAADVSLEDVRHVFDRPTEPIFTLRGIDRDVAFDIPPEYLPKRYQRVALDVARNFDGDKVRRIPIRAIDVPIELLDTLSVLPFRSKYSFAIKAHASIMLEFSNFFTGTGTLDELLSAIVWARCHFNPEMVLDAARKAILAREDTQGLQLPEVTLYHPELFVQDSFFARAREEMWLISDPRQRAVIPVLRNGTASAADEDALWFFREDAGLSLFHWHWHLNHPNTGEISTVAKDRRGELFAYFHRQILARYNANRFCLGMEPVVSLRLREPISEGYAPKLALLHSSRSFPSREANTTLQDIILSSLSASRKISDMEGWVAAVREAIQRGSAVTPSGLLMPLESVDGLDILADALEGVSALSPHYELYGNLHNALHRVVGYAHDPRQLFQEPMGTIATLNIIRDPVFYRIHSFMDDLYEEFKTTLKPYDKSDLVFPEVQVSSVQVLSDGSDVPNELHTLWLETDVDVSMGLEYTAPGQLFARFQRMVHQPFQYIIQAKNTGNSTKQGFVRIFLLLEQDGSGNPLDLRSIQRWSIEMDRFKATLPPGKSQITRRSVDTPVAIDPDDVYTAGQTLQEIRTVNHCRCGFPLSLMLPRGTPEGLPVTLFAMISDYEIDGVDPSDEEVCRRGWALCGAPGSQLYPDRKPMGFPFDRRLPRDFLMKNMAMQDVLIKFHDRVRDPSPLLPGSLSTSWKLG